MRSVWLLLLVACLLAAGCGKEEAREASESAGPRGDRLGRAGLGDWV